MAKTAFDQFKPPFRLRKIKKDGEEWSSLQDSEGDEFVGSAFDMERHAKMRKLQLRLNATAR